MSSLILIEKITNPTLSCGNDKIPSSLFPPDLIRYHKTSCTKCFIITYATGPIISNLCLVCKSQ